LAKDASDGFGNFGDRGNWPGRHGPSPIRGASGRARVRLSRRIRVNLAVTRGNPENDHLTASLDGDMEVHIALRCVVRSERLVLSVGTNGDAANRCQQQILRETSPYERTIDETHLQPLAGVENGDGGRIAVGRTDRVGCGVVEG